MRPTKEILPIIWSVGIIYLLAKSKIYQVFSIAIVIASIVNIFIGSTVMQMVISALAIVIFLGLTAYDTQKIREMVSVEGDTGRQEVIGALTLYMDFINLFINLLQLFGIKKD